MKINNRIVLILAAVGGAVVSAMLLRHHYDLSYHSSLCGMGEKNGCNILNRSSASEIFNIPVALIGFLYYTFAFFLSLYSEKEKSLIQILLLMSVFGVIVDITLLLYSLFVVETICVLCSFTYIASLFLAVFSYLEIKKSQLGFFPSFKNWQKESFSLAQVSWLIIFIVFLTGGYLFQAYSKTGGTSARRAGYENNMIIAENEYIKAYEKGHVYQFSNDPSSKKGPLQATLNIVEFADFMCPHCKMMGMELDKFVKTHPDDVNVTYRHFPLDNACNRAIPRKFHEGSCMLSYSSYCALQQGHFWEMTDEIFNNQRDITARPVTMDIIRLLARPFGLDNPKFQACMSSDETHRAIELDVEEGIGLGIQGTPTIYINGRKMDFNPYLTERLLFYLKQKAEAERKQSVDNAAF